jgi:hypothetical protein
MFKKEKIWTTLSAIFGFVLLGLVVFGVITGEQKQLLHDSWDAVVAVIPGGDATVIIGAVLLFVQQIVLVFVKDPKLK